MRRRELSLVSPELAPTTPLVPPVPARVAPPAVQTSAPSAPEAPVLAIEVPHWGDWRLAPPPADRKVVGCPSCVRGDSGTPVATLVVESVTGRFLCARCGHHGDARVLPSQYRGHPAFELLLQTPVPKTSLASVLTGLGLDAAAVTQAVPEVHLGHGWFAEENIAEKNGWQPCLLLPVRTHPQGPVVDVIQIQFDPTTHALVRQQRAVGGQAIPWGWSEINDIHAVLVGDPLDALALRGAGEVHVAALPACMHPHSASGGDWKILAHPDVEARVAQLTDVVIALPDTEGNHRFEDELGRRMGRERCRRTRWRSPDTAGELGRCAARVVAEQGPTIALAFLKDATPFPIVGIHELMDVDERFELLYEFGLQPGVSTGWPSLDTHYTIKPGQWSVVTGIPGHGKSTVLDALLVNLARLHKWRFGLFSPENQPIERHFASLMEKALGAPFNDGKRPRITREQKNLCKEWLNEHFKIVLPDDEKGNWTLDGVLELARVLVYRHGIHGLVIDPWNELDHARPSNLTETEHISLCLTKIRRFARLYGVHIWVVAHPTKLEPRADGKYPVPTPYMISGGAHWRNKADCALAVFRNVGEADDDISDIHVQKIRFKEVGRVGRVSLRSELTCGRFHDDLHQERRAKALADGKIVPSRDILVPERVYASSETGLAFMDDGHDPLA